MTGEPQIAKLVLKAVSRFTKVEVQEHLDKHHPNCPPKISKRVVSAVAGGPWVDANLGAAVGLALQAAIRHNLTAYDAEIATAEDTDKAMIKKKYNREAARIIASWNSSRTGNKRG